VGKKERKRNTAAGMSENKWTVLEIISWQKHGWQGIAISYNKITTHTPNLS
jgi:hypothetical protein